MQNRLEKDAADSAFDIPVLREKQKERKGAGVPWYAGSGGGPSGAVLGTNVVRVGSSMTQPGFFGSARIAAAVSRALGGPSSALGGFFATRLGSMAVLAGMAFWAVVMSAAVVKTLSRVSPASGVPALAAAPISSDIVIDVPKDRSLDYVASANRGEIPWEKPTREAKGPDAAGTAETVPAAETAPKAPEQPAMPDVSKVMAEAMQKGALNRDGFLTKLSQGNGSMVGGAGLGKLRDSLAPMNISKTFAGAGLPKPVKLGNTEKMKRAMERLKAGRRTPGRVSASRAMGQLKFARNASVSAMQATVDSQSKQYATDAFEQGRIIGGQIAGLESGSGIVVPPGNGAPGVSDSAPDVPGTNVTPYQPQVDAARNLDDQAAQNKNMGDMLKMIGALLLAAGLALMAIGMALMNNPLTAIMGAVLLGIGAVLMAAGIALMAMGGAMNNKAKDQANQAKQQGRQIEDQYGQEDQGEVIDECSSLAEAGIATAGCPGASGADAAARSAASTVREAVEAERTATFAIEGEAVR